MTTTYLVKKKKSKLAGGGTLPAGYTELLGAGIDQFNTNNDPILGGASGILKGAGTGFTLGNTIVPGIGGLIGGGAGAIIGLLSGVSQNKRRAAEEDKAQRLEQENTDKMKAIMKANSNIGFASMGHDKLSYFAMGGELNSPDGTLKPVAPNAKKVVGDTHSQDSNGDGSTGVTVQRGGQPLAEVENAEVIVGDRFVFSNQLLVPGTKTSFAQLAESIAKNPTYQKERKIVKNAEKSLEEDSFNPTINTARRNIEKNPDQLEAVFGMQEQIKAMLQQQQEQQMQQGQPQGEQLPTAAEGIDLGKIASSTLPFLDNIVNAGLTKQTPELPKPTYVQAPTLDTEFNINPQLAAIDRSAAIRNTALGRSSNNSGVTRANILAGADADIQARNQLYGQKENTETQLNNQQALLDSRADSQNATIFDKFQLDQVLRKDDIAGRISANVANAVEDAQGIQRTQNEEVLDKQRLALTAAKYLDTGVLQRAHFDEVMRIIDSGGSVADAMAFMQSAMNARKSNNRIAPKIPSLDPGRFFTHTFKGN